MPKTLMKRNIVIRKARRGWWREDPTSPDLKRQPFYECGGEEETVESDEIFSEEEEAQDEETVSEENTKALIEELKQFSRYK